LPQIEALSHIFFEFETPIKSWERLTHMEELALYYDFMGESFNLHEK
jgi:hypothetical protein